MTPLHSVEGHEGLLTALARAFHAGRLPPVLLLHGTPGVGKQRVGLWIGQLLLCEEPTLSGPCGRCVGCNLSTRIEHPDLHWYFPVKRPPSRGSRERDREALEEIRADRLTELRTQPLQASIPGEVRGLHLATIRNVKREAERRPALAPRRLFLIADSEELVAQESSADAANAMLKLLEEPPPETWFVLTSSEPGRLLPTVRSRATAAYLPPLPRPRVREFLLSEVSAPLEDVERATSLSDGSIGRALGFLPDGGEPGALESVRRDAFHLLRAAVDPGDAARSIQALSVSPAGARGLQPMLSALEGWIRDLVVLAAGSDVPLLNQDGRDWLSKTVLRRNVDPARAAHSLAYVQAARSRAAGNVNPQLFMARLLSDLHDALTGTPSRRATSHIPERP